MMSTVPASPRMETGLGHPEHALTLAGGTWRGNSSHLFLLLQCMMAGMNGECVWEAGERRGTREHSEGRSQEEEERKERRKRGEKKEGAEGRGSPAWEGSTVHTPATFYFSVNGSQFVDTEGSTPNSPYTVSESQSFKQLETKKLWELEPHLSSLPPVK